MGRHWEGRGINNSVGVPAVAVVQGFPIHEKKPENSYNAVGDVPGEKYAQGLMAGGTN